MTDRPRVIHTVAGTALLLLPEKAIYIPEFRVLVLADLHLGKSMHFRKSGLPLPVHGNEKDYRVLDMLVNCYRPERIMFLGDLFHSDHNHEWERFALWRHQYTSLDMLLVEGNHDIMHPRHYLDAGITTMEAAVLGGILWTHEPLAEISGHAYHIYGHIHPAVRLSGVARQSVRVPCFIFGERKGVMPAFGKLTGLHVLYPSKTDSIYGITNDKVLHLKAGGSQTV